MDIDGDNITVTIESGPAASFLHYDKRTNILSVGADLLNKDDIGHYPITITLSDDNIKIPRSRSYLIVLQVEPIP